MFKQLQALLWSRKELLLANKQNSIALLFPLIFTAIYSFMYKDMPDGNQFIFMFTTATLSGMVGMILPITVSEEDEKHNQRSLLLSGVTYEVYLLANIIIPLVVIILYLLTLPLLLRVGLTNWLAYLAVNIVTSFVILTFYMIVALLCDTQSKASLAAMPVMFATMLLPMLAMSDEGLAKMIHYTPLGAYAKWNVEGAEYVLTDKTFIVLVGWLLVAFAVAVLLVKRSKVKE